MPDATSKLEALLSDLQRHCELQDRESLRQSNRIAALEKQVFTLNQQLADMSGPQATAQVSEPPPPHY
jgi:uncharacterized coiled-coil protein SlyX